MHVPLSRPSPLIALALALAIVITACQSPSPFEVEGSPSRSFPVSVGENFSIDVGGAGPNFAVPPTLVGSTIEFLSEAPQPSNVVGPGGVVQQYQFKGIATGQTVVTFVDGEQRTIVDTIVVK